MVYIQISPTSLVFELNFKKNILPQTRLFGLIWMKTNIKIAAIFKWGLYIVLLDFDETKARSMNIIFISFGVHTWISKFPAEAKGHPTHSTELGLQSPLLNTIKNLKKKDKGIPDNENEFDFTPYLSQLKCQ